MLDLFYVLSFVIVLLFFLLMFLRPRKVSTERLLSSYLGFIVIGALHLFTLVGVVLGGIGRIVFDFRSVAGVAALFSDPLFALVIWLHIMVVDLAALYYVYHETTRLTPRNGLVRLFLLLTFVLAPFGLFVFGLWRVLSRASRERALEPETPSMSVVTR